MSELFMLIIVMSIIVFWIFGLVDILKHEFTGVNKIIWLVVYLFFPVLGFILYFMIGRRQRII